MTVKFSKVQYITFCFFYNTVQYTVLVCPDCVNHRGPRLGIYWMDRRLPRKSDSVVRIRRYLELYCKDVFEYSTVHVISSTVWYRLRLV